MVSWKPRCVMPLKPACRPKPSRATLGPPAISIREHPQTRAFLLDLMREVVAVGRAPRACNSCGLGLMRPEAAAEEAEQLLEGGFKAVKLRLGYATLDEDVAVTRSVRRRLPDNVELMVDYNQALSLDDALVRGRALQGEGVA